MHARYVKLKLVTVDAKQKRLYFYMTKISFTVISPSIHILFLVYISDVTQTHLPLQSMLSPW